MGREITCSGLTMLGSAIPRVWIPSMAADAGTQLVFYRSSWEEIKYNMIVHEQKLQGSKCWCLI